MRSSLSVMKRWGAGRLWLVPFVAGIIAPFAACVGEDPGATSSSSSGGTSGSTSSGSTSSSGDANNSNVDGASSGSGGDKDGATDGPAGPCRTPTVQPVPSGLIAYWPLQDVALTDLTGQHASTAVQGSGGTLVAVADRFGCAKSAIALVGGAGIELGKSSLINDAVSIQLWVKEDTAADAGTFPTLLGNEIQSSSDNGTVTVYHNAQTLTLALTHGSGFGMATFNQFTTNVWHQIVVTVTDTRGQLYVDGVLRQASNFTGLLITTITGKRNWRIGRNFDGTRPFQGSVDDVRFYNRVLSDAEVKSLYEEHSFMP